MNRLKKPPDSQMSVYRRNQIVYVIVYDFISHADTAHSFKVDIDNSQMCNMIDRVPKE